MYAVSTSTSWFGARTVVAALALTSCIVLAEAQQQSDGCRVECYPNTKVINGKGAGALSSGNNCRWILRTDGKPARLCDHIKCRKVCPNNQAASVAAQQDQQDVAASDNLRIEQKIEGDGQQQAEQQPMSQPESMGIMRQLHGGKLAKAPVPGVAGGRLSVQPQQQQNQQAPTGGRRQAPTLPPSVQYDENDTPPPISRFLDISPEE